MRTDNSLLILAIEAYLACTPLPHGAVAEVSPVKHLAPTQRNGEKGPEFCPWPYAGPVHVSFYVPFRRVTCVNGRDQIGKLLDKLKRAHGLTFSRRSAGPRPIRSTANALSAMLAEKDIQGIRDAYAAGWPGVWLANINTRNASEGYLVGAPLPGVWSDCCKASAVLVGPKGVTWEQPEIHHIATGLRVCGAKQVLGAAYRARVVEALDLRTKRA